MRQLDATPETLLFQMSILISKKILRLWLLPPLSGLLFELEADLPKHYDDYCITVLLYYCNYSQSD